MFRAEKAVKTSMVFFSPPSFSIMPKTKQGVEPWHYYVRNLSFLFNICYPLFLISPFLTFRKALRTKSEYTWRLLHFFVPSFTWLLFFTWMPHKEERFLFPIYPFIAICSAFSLTQSFGLANRIFRKKGSQKAIYVIFILISMGRVYAQVIWLLCFHPRKHLSHVFCRYNRFHFTGLLWIYGRK